MIVDAAATPTDLLDAGARLSRRFGEDPEYARAGGGNSSVKDGGDAVHQAQRGLAGIR